MLFDYNDILLIYTTNRTSVQSVALLVIFIVYHCMHTEQLHEHLSVKREFKIRARLECKQ